MTRIVIETESLRATARTIRRTQHELDSIGSGLRHVAAPRPGLTLQAQVALGEVEDVVTGLRRTAGALDPWARELQRTADFVERDDIAVPSWIARPSAYALLPLGWTGLLGMAGLLGRSVGAASPGSAGADEGFFTSDMRGQLERLFPWVDDDVWDAIESIDDIFETLFSDFDKIVDAYCDASEAFHREVADFIGYLPTAAIEYAKGVAGILTADPSQPWYAQLVADLIPYTAIPRSIFGFGREVLEGDVGSAVLEGGGLILTAVGLKAGLSAFKLAPGGRDIAEVAIGWTLDHIGVDEWITDHVDDLIDDIYEISTGVGEAADIIELGAREFSEAASRTVVGAVKHGASNALDWGRSVFRGVRDTAGTILRTGWSVPVGVAKWLFDRGDDALEEMFDELARIARDAFEDILRPGSWMFKPLSFWPPLPPWPIWPPVRPRLPRWPIWPLPIWPPLPRWPIWPPFPPRWPRFPGFPIWPPPRPGVGPGDGVSPGIPSPPPSPPSPPSQPSPTAFRTSLDEYPFKNEPLTLAAGALSEWGNPPTDEWGFYKRSCTGYVAWRLNQEGMPFSNTMQGGQFGHAGNWDENAQAIRPPMTVNQTPKAGCIAVFDYGDYGHVAFVESVNDDGTVNISEYNYPNKPDPKNQSDWGNPGRREHVRADKYIHVV